MQRGLATWHTVDGVTAAVVAKYEVVPPLVVPLPWYRVRTYFAFG
jgi:hypothetical protein